jgi:hypothetical protein
VSCIDQEDNKPLLNVGIRTHQFEDKIGAHYQEVFLYLYNIPIGVLGESKGEAQPG